MPQRKGKSERIILELLHHPKGSLSKYRIAKETETNISWVIQFLKKLEQKKLVKNTKVINFDKLIDHYLDLVPKIKSFDFMLREPLPYLKKMKRPYALTTYAGDYLISHHLFLSRFDLYIMPEEIETWKKELFKKGLVGKGNLRLLVPKDFYLFKFTQKIKGLKVVSIPLLMIDLKREGGVCMQAYEYLGGHHTFTEFWRSTFCCRNQR